MRPDAWTVVTMTVTAIWAVAYLTAMFFDSSVREFAAGITPVLLAVIGGFTANKVSERIGPTRRNGNGNGGTDEREK